MKETKQTNYVTVCTLPRNYIVTGEKQKGICGRYLTESMVRKNECPLCHRTLKEVK